MIEKKTLTENNIVELSEDELDKVSGGRAWQVGDVCPYCKCYYLELKPGSMTALRCPQTGCSFNSRS